MEHFLSVIVLPDTWQDAVLMMGNLVFFLALLPSIFSEDKPHAWTSFLTGTVLTAFALVYASLGLKFGMVAISLTAIAWFVLLIQKLKASRG